MNILTQNNQQSMTSQQMAELCQKRHDSVKRTIETLMDKSVISYPQIVIGPKAANGVAPTHYIFTGEQGRLDSIIVVAQLSPEFTGELVYRWDELEKQLQQPVKPALPQDYISALEELLVTKKSEQIALEQVKELQPKADALDALSSVKGSLGIRDTAKAVGIAEREFVTRCIGKNKPPSSRFMFRDNAGKLNACARRIKQGFMTQKITSYEGKGGQSFVTIKVAFTPAGVAHIAKLMQVKAVKQLGVAV